MKVKVELSVYDWHNLLGIIEQMMEIRSLNPKIPKSLYEKIASQLHDAEVEVKIEEVK